MKKPDAVDEAMQLLLSARQIAFVRSRTSVGLSRKDIIKKLIARGIKDWRTERENEISRARWKDAHTRVVAPRLARVLREAWERAESGDDTVTKVEYRLIDR